MRIADWSEQKLGNLVICTLCPHNCTIADGQNGLCRVRGNRNGELYSFTYGQVISAATDPIEKKPLYHYHPGASTLSIGSVGCNLHCQHCQNWQISQLGSDEAGQNLHTLSPANAVAETIARGTDILVFTYNEPSLWYEYILDCAEVARLHGVKLVMVTSGVINPQPLQKLLKVIDAYRVDIKGFRHDFYKRLTGFDLLDQVLDNTRDAYQSGVHVELVTNLIPGWNDDEGQLRDLACWIHDELSPSVPWHITRYVPNYKMTEPATSVATLERSLEIGREEGLRHIYLGNIGPHETDQTNCSSCGEWLIKRSGYKLIKNRINVGSCSECGEPVGNYRG